MWQSPKLTINLNRKYFFHLLMILLLHGILFSLDGKMFLKNSSLMSEINSTPTKIKIRKIKTNEVKNSKLKTNQAFINPAVHKKNKSYFSAPKHRDNISFEKLSHDLLQDINKFKDKKSITTRKKNNLLTTSKNKEAKKISDLSLNKLKNSFNGQDFTTEDLEISKILEKNQNVKDAIVSIEVPDGVRYDELNEYELKFYGFQRRVAIRYINSILKNINQFQKENPHFKISSSDRIVMTARITYDQDGHVTQIKMIKWTQINKIQNLFEEIVKGIDQLQNPPESLWQGKGEFSMFYTLDIIY